MEFNYEFYTSLRYEIFYAVQLITDESSTVHSEWKKNTIDELSNTFFEKLNQFGLEGAIWTVLADMLKSSALTYSFDELIKTIREISTAEIQKNILIGVLHYSDIVECIINKEIDLETAIKKIPKEKYEWLAYIGLYPFNKDRPINRTMEIVISNAEEFKNIIIDILIEFWKSTFENTWKDISPKLQGTASEKNRLCDICTLAEFSKNTMLTIEVDEKKKKILALRGGYSIQFTNIDKLIFFPSVFNYKRLWTAYESDDSKTIACFPFFDPTISLTNINPCDRESEIDSVLDPALIFKALGDVTRFAIVTIIAREPKNSVELSKILSLSKATISHHMHILREAGLINESYENGSVKLNLKRNVIENLSNMTISKLYRN